MRITANVHQAAVGTCPTFTQLFFNFRLDGTTLSCEKTQKCLEMMPNMVLNQPIAKFSAFAQVAYNKLPWLEGEGPRPDPWMPRNRALDTNPSEWPYGHLHAIKRVCMRSGAGTGGCAPPGEHMCGLQRLSCMNHSMKRPLLGIIWYWSMTNRTHVMNHTSRTHVHMTHAQKFEVGYRRAVLGPTALSWRIDIVMQCKPEYLSRVSYTYAMF